MKNLFRKFSDRMDDLIGSPWTFVALLLFIIAWFVVGYIFDYPETLQIVFDNGTNVVFLILLFLMQNSQNRDSKIIHLKLDELLCANEGARTYLAGLKEMPEEEVDQLATELRALSQQPGKADK